MDYSNKTKKELYLLAKEKDVNGYSKMNKAELVEALTVSKKEHKPDKVEESPKEPQKKLVFNSMLHRYVYR